MSDYCIYHGAGHWVQNSLVMSQIGRNIDFSVFLINDFKASKNGPGLRIVSKEREVPSKVWKFGCVLMLFAWSSSAGASDTNAIPSCFDGVGGGLRSRVSLLAAIPLHAGSGEMLGWFDEIQCASELDLDGDGNHDVVAKIRYLLRYDEGARTESVLHVFVFSGDAHGILREAAREGPNFFAEGGGRPPEVTPIPVGARIELLWVDADQYSDSRRGVVQRLEHGRVLEAPAFGDGDIMACRNDPPPPCAAGHYFEQRAESVVVVGEGCSLRLRKGRCRSRRVVNELVLEP